MTTIPIKKGNWYSHIDHGKVVITSVTSRVNSMTGKRMNLVLFMDDKKEVHTVSKYEFGKKSTPLDPPAAPKEEIKPEEKAPEATDSGQPVTQKAPAEIPEENIQQPTKDGQPVDQKQAAKKPEEKRIPTKESGGTVPWYEEETCYVTTILVHKFGLEDNCKYLATMRSFRDDVLSKSASGRALIDVYEEIGPKCAEFYAVKAKEECLGIMELLKQTAYYIEKGNYELAMQLYFVILCNSNPDLLTTNPMLIVDKVRIWIDEYSEITTN